MCCLDGFSKIHTNGNAEKDGKIFLLTKFVRREKKMAKILQAVKKMTKIYQVFLGFLGFFRLI